MSQVVHVGALVALAAPLSAPPHVHAVARLAILDEVALVAVAVRPGLHPVAVLHPGAEAAFVLGDAARAALAVGEPVITSYSIHYTKLYEACPDHDARVRRRVEEPLEEETADQAARAGEQGGAGHLNGDCPH